MQARLPVGRLGFHPLPADPPQLGELVAGGAEPGLARRVGEPLARPPRLGHRVGPLAVELHQLGPAQEALAAVGHQVRLGGAPAGERGGPLLRATPVEDLVAAGDHPAVHVARDERRDLAGGDGDHRLVEQRHTLERPPQPDQGPALPVAGERDQIGVVESLARRRRAREGVGNGLAAQLAEIPDRVEQQQVAELDAVAPALLQQPSGTSGPARALGRLPSVEEAEGEPDRTARRPLRRAGGEELPVGPGPVLRAFCLATQQAARDGETLDVVRAQRCAPVRRAERGAGLAPRAAPEGATTSLEIRLAR